MYGVRCDTTSVTAALSSFFQNKVGSVIFIVVLKKNCAIANIHITAPHSITITKDDYHSRENGATSHYA